MQTADQNDPRDLPLPSPHAAQPRIAEALQDQLIAVIEGTSDLVSTATPDGKLIYLNQAGRKLAGWGAEESLEGRVIGDLHPAWALQRIETEGLPTAAATGHWEGETALLHREGREVPVSQVILAQRSAEGVLQCFSTIMRDISGRKRAEEALHQREGSNRESARLLEALFDAIPDVLGVQDRQRRIIRYNAAGYRYLGLSPEQVRGRVCYELIGRVKPCEVCATAESLQTKKPSQVEKHVPELGTWLECRSYPVLDAGGDVIYIIEHLRDITERKQAEAALRRAEARYRSLFDNALEGIYQTSPEGAILAANPAMARMLGYASPEELMGERRDLARQGYADPRKREEFRRLVEAHGTVVGFEYELRRKDGSRLWVSENARAVRDQQGHVTHYEGAMEDITERKRAEQSLRDSEQLYQSLVENLQQCVFRKDREGRFTFANQRFCDLVGRPLAGLMGQTDFDLFPRELAEKYRHDDRQVMASGVVFEGVESQRTAAGEERFVQAVKTPLRDANGQVVGLQGIFWDITERQRAESDLRKEQAFSDKLIESLPGIFYLYDGDLRLRRWNRNHETSLGYTAAELVKMRVADWHVSEENRAAAEAGIRRTLSTGETTSIDCPLRHKDGRSIPYLLTATKIETESGPMMMGVGLDMTKSRQAEQDKERLQAQLTQAQKMESVGRLAGGVAHDFNNMLQAILGNTALALQDLPPGSPLREHLEEIEKSAQRSADLTRQLLTFARKQTIQPKVIDLNDTVAGMLKMLQRLIGEDIDMAWMPGEDLWPVRMDPSQVDQILANLCVNARDAIAGTGKVTIETANVSLDDTSARTHPDCAPGDYVMLALSDTGKGMDDETRSHLFEPFFTTKEPGKGTGLGLATVFGIIKQNRGLINVSSKPGRGTTFEIYLPRAEAEAIVAPQKTIRRARRGTETVLVVEDEPQILNLGRRILEQHGYTVLTASTPARALTLATQHAGPIHLLITDVVLPGMNGKQLRDKLQASRPDLKCLFISGYTANVIAHHGVLDNGVQYLQKPFTLQGLAEKVREALEQPLRP